MKATRMVIGGMLAIVALTALPALNVVDSARADACVTVNDLPPAINNRRCTGVLGSDAVRDEHCATLQEVCDRPIYNPLTGEEVARITID